MKKLKFMSTIAATVISITAVSASFPVFNASADNDNVKILCLGDSITDGYFGTDGYRKYLYHELDNMGYTIDMVGAKSGGSSYTSNNGEYFKYDGDHSGYSGYSIENISGGYESRQGIRELVEGTWYSDGKNMIESCDPDIVLLQIGTNDILSAYNNGITDRLEGLVNVILNDMNDPDDMLYVASIPYIDAYVRGDWLGGYGFNWWGSSYEDKTLLMEKVSECIDKYNASIQDMVARMQAEGKHIAFGDINGVVDYQTDLEDGCHPNETGYEKMGVYWANLISNDYFGGQESEVTKPVVTTATTTTTSSVTTTTATQPAVTTTKLESTTAAPVTTTTISTTTTAKPVIPSGNDIVIENASFGESYDLSAYKGMDINSVSFIFESTPPYGMNGCAVFGNWELSKNYTSDDMNDLSINVELDKEYSSVTLHKWYGDTELSKIILHTGNSQDNTTTKPVTTTTKPTTTTTTTTKPTTITTTTTKPTTTTTTTTKPTTTTTTTTKPTTTTTTTTKPTTTTTTTTTSATTTTVTQNDDENSIVLTDVELNKEYSLKDYDYKSISKIVIKWKGDIGYGFGGNLVLGSWTVQNSYGHNDMTDDGTIEIEVKEPQDKFTLYRYWGSIELESVTLYF